MFTYKVGAYRVEIFMTLHSKGRLLASRSDIRLGWMSLMAPNTLAYYDKVLITVMKVLKYGHPWVNFIIFFII